MEYKVTITPRAKRDLVGIWRYISKDNSNAAGSFCHDLAQHAYSLGIFPIRGTSLSSRPEIRKVPYQNYLIFFKVFSSEHRIEILRFWHGARDQRRLRLKEESSAYAQAAQPVS